MPNIGPVNVTHPYHISSAHGRPLEDESLIDIATAFASIDAEFLYVLDNLFQVAANGAIGGTTAFDDDAGSPQARQKDQATVSDLQKQLKDVKLGKHDFHEGYLQDRYMLTMWARAHSGLTVMLDFVSKDQANRSHLIGIDPIFRNIERMTELLFTHIPAAARKGTLTSDTRAVIRLRMLQLDETNAMYRQKTNNTLNAKTW